MKTQVGQISFEKKASRLIPARLKRYRFMSLSITKLVATKARPTKASNVAMCLTGMSAQISPSFVRKHVFINILQNYFSPTAFLFVKI